MKVRTNITPNEVTSKILGLFNLSCIQIRGGDAGM